ncbi:hypothetical protein [Caldicellulosiruptor acetigenus]|uniref:Uncharacterized protein n=1 Tax=Caldicellulosiruptor acetigenus 6A TaxID=632516 RepID=G2PVU3_9FIRM|nr:hypothetical protein [Caldicellulosiruptor acetigenus]AEM72837.1 hypothetical protein Calla_0152 [Caldicellulosiruptor acetigenus 6A]
MRITQTNTFEILTVILEFHGICGICKNLDKKEEEKISENSSNDD